MIISFRLFVFKVVEDGVSAGRNGSVSEGTNFELARFVHVQVADAEEIPLVVRWVLCLYL